MPRVRFLEERIVQNEHRHDPKLQTVMRVGEVYELSDASYHHWLARAPLELVLADPPPLRVTPVAVAPAPPAPAPFATSLTDQPEKAALGDVPFVFSPPEEPPSAAEKSPPKPGGKPKG